MEQKKKDTTSSEYITNSPVETIRIGKLLAQQVLKPSNSVDRQILDDKQSNVIALYGDLGSGKTTFVQGFAKGLGIDRVNSPTFLIMREYAIPSSVIARNEVTRQSSGSITESGVYRKDSHASLGMTPKNFYHVDLYRVENEMEIEDLGLLEVMRDPENIVVIEWAEKVRSLLPQKRVEIFFEYIGEEKRRINIKHFGK